MQENLQPNPYESLKLLFDIRSKSLSCEPLQEAIFSSDHALFFQMVDSPEAFAAFEKLLDAAEHDEKKRENIEWFLRDKCGIIGMQLSQIDSLLREADVDVMADLINSDVNDPDKSNLHYIQERARLFQKIKKIVFTLSKSQQTLPEVKHFVATLEKPNAEQPEDNGFSEEELQPLREAEPPSSVLFLQLLENRENLIPIFGFLNSSKSREVLSKLVRHAALERLKVAFINKKMVDTPNNLPAEQLYEIVSKQYGWTVELNEEVIIVLEEAVEKVSTLIELYNVRAVFQDAIDIIRTLFPRVESLTGFSRSRSAKLDERIRQREEEITTQGREKILQEIEDKTEFVRMIERGEITTQEQLIEYFKENLTPTELLQLGDGGVEKLTDSTISLSIFAVDGKEDIRAAFGKDMIKGLTEQSTQAVDRMIQIWLRLGMLKRDPDELSYGEERYYLISPEFAQALQALFDDEDEDDESDT